MTDEEFIDRLNKYLKPLEIEIKTCNNTSIKYCLIAYLSFYNETCNWYYKNFEELINGDRYVHTLFKIFEKDMSFERNKYISLIKGNTKEEILLKLQLMGY